MRFAYIKDPLFLTCLAGYWLNRFIIKNIPHHAFFDNYFNDLICIPFLIPIMLWIMKRTSFRIDNRPPDVFEVMIPVLIWATMFEIIFPQHPFWSKWVTGDPVDVVCYAIGGCISLVIWTTYYKQSDERQPGRILDTCNEAQR